MQKRKGKAYGMRAAAALCFSLMLAGLCTGCGAEKAVSSADESADTGAFVSPEESYEKTETASAVIHDKKSLYEAWDDSQVRTVYLTVGKGNASDETDHTWAEVNEAGSGSSCEAVIQFGDETSPQPGCLGYGQQTANASVSLQGTGAAQKQQKSYRISMRDSAGTLDGIKTLVLSKEFSDPLRIRDRLCAGLLQEIPGLFSTRTEFIHLYVKDRSEGGDPLFVDYGLYTLKEPVNKNYLTQRGLSKSTELYKAVNFDWRLHEDVLMEATAAAYDAAAFEQLLEIKGDSDHEVLLEALAEVNDPDIPVSDVIEEYFDADNLYDYMAFCILMGKKDAALENCYYYVPEGTEKLILIPWDNNSVLQDAYSELEGEINREPWNYGIFCLTDSLLFERILKDHDCRDRLSDSVDALYRGALAEENIKAKTQQLTALAKPFVYALPDITFAPVEEDEYDTLAAGLYAEIDANYNAFYDSLDAPWPFHILQPETRGDGTWLRWDASYLQEGEASYSICLDDSWDFASPIGEWAVTGETEVNAGALAQGEYFVKITAASDSGKSQEAREFYNTEKKTAVTGTLCFYILSDGSARECRMEE